MEEWKSYKLCEICDLIPGFAFKSADFGDYSTKAIKIGDIQPPYVNRASMSGVNIEVYDKNKLSKFLVKRGDFVLAMTGATIGKIGRYIEQEPAYLNQRVLLFRPHANVNPRFVYYSLLSPLFQKYIINHIDSETAQPNISARSVSGFEIMLPSREEQDIIASLLSSIDDKIEINTRINHNLEEQAQALYKSWFVDFEPFKDGKFIDSEFGMIPDGWRVLSFEDFTDLSNERVDSETIPEFSITNNGIFPRDAKFNKQLSSSSLKNKVIRKGDLVFGMSREILNWGIMKEPVGGVSSAYTVYTVDKTLVTPQYLEFFIKNHLSYFKDLIKPAAREGQGIDKTVLSSKLIILPNMDVWERFSLVLDVLFKERLHITSELLELTRYRNELLPALMKGHITC